MMTKGTAAKTQWGWLRPSPLARLLTLILCLALPALARGANLTATLEDKTTATMVDGAEHWQWQSFWILSWQPTAKAVGYAIAYKTAEGTSKKIEIVTEPWFKIEVAKGMNPKSAGLRDRDIQLLTIQSLLAVRVAPRFADGTLGAPSPWLEVGRVYP